MKSFPLTQADFYKLSHKKFMVDGATKIYANFTARSGKYAKWADDKKRVVFAGLQHFIKEFLIEEWNREFFNKPKAEVIAKFKRRVETSLGVGAVSMAHFEALHDLGYLPLKIKALPEGSKVPFKVPLLTIVNTDEDFAWLVTYIETVLSTELWATTTAATTAYQFLTLCNSFADQTVGNRNHVMFQCHDFSARGVIGRNGGALTGLGHLMSFSGTDTVAAIDLVEDYYNVDASKYFIAASVPASEHSVTSLGSSVLGEFDTIKSWVTEAYPTGIVSVVSDTYDYWRVLTEFLPAMKDDIEARKPNELGLAKVVVRPDSGDPAHVIAGYRPDEYYVENIKFPGEYAIGEVKYKTVYTCRLTGKELTENEVKGSIELLWETFGGTVNKFGYRELAPCIGLIYGDSITLERADDIFRRLQQRGFASNNVVFGVGSYTYQMASRDTLGMAVKATAAVVDGQLKELFKDPATDDGTKKSARGLMRVELIDGEYVMFDRQSEEQEAAGELRTAFEDGALLIDETFEVIRARVQDIVLEEDATN